MNLLTCIAQLLQLLCIELNFDVILINTLKNKYFVFVFIQNLDSLIVSTSN